MIWTKQDFTKWLAEEKKWDRFKLVPFHTLIDGVLEVPDYQYLFGSLSLKANYQPTGGGTELVETDNLLTPFDLQPNAWDSFEVVTTGGTISRGTTPAPYGDGILLETEEVNTGQSSIWAPEMLTLSAGSLYVFGAFYKFDGAAKWWSIEKWSGSDPQVWNLQNVIEPTDSLGYNSTNQEYIEDFGDGWRRVQLLIYADNGGAVPCFRIGLDHQYNTGLALFRPSLRKLDVSEADIMDVQQPLFTEQSLEGEPLGAMAETKERQVVCRKIEDSTGACYFTGWKAIRQ